MVPNFIISINILLKRAEDKAPNKRAEDKAPIMVRTKLNVCYAWTQFKQHLSLIILSTCIQEIGAKQQLIIAYIIYTHIITDQFNNISSII